MSLLRQSVALLLAALIASAPAQTPSPPPPPIPTNLQQQTQEQTQEQPDKPEKLPAAAPLPAALATCISAPRTSDNVRPAYFPSYLEDSFLQLRTAVPALRTLRFEDHPATTADDAEPILNQAAEALIAMVPRVPNLIAKEELSQVNIPLPYQPNTGTISTNVGSTRRGMAQVTTTPSSSGPAQGADLEKVLENMLDQPQQRTYFSYRIRAAQDPNYGPVLEEYRTNAKEQSVDPNDYSAGNPRSVGYGNTWMMFVPANLQESRFRYLGRQKIDRHDTLVIAFAQDPDHATMRAAVGVGADACRYFIQGILWIDQSFFQIIRLQTDLVSPLTGIHLNQLRSELRFSEVKIPTRNLILWMPSDVKISWQGKDSAGMELHRYSNYRLFAATSRIIIPDPE
jgi:hypothetical protein